MSKEEELNRKHARIILIIERTFGFGTTLAWCFTICFASYFAFYAPIVETAGQVTAISTTANWVADFRLHWLVPVALAGACGVGWKRDRSQRFKERGEKDERIAELERRLDPSRTSSNLDPAGKPKKGGKK